MACLSTSLGHHAGARSHARLKVACEQAIIRFQEIDSVSGTLPGEDRRRPRADLQREQLRDVPQRAGRPRKQPGPEQPDRPAAPIRRSRVANLDGAINVVPSFITAADPCVRAGSESSTGCRTAAWPASSPSPDASTLRGAWPRSPISRKRSPTRTSRSGSRRRPSERASSTTSWRRRWRPTSNAAPAGAPSSASLGIGGLLNRARQRRNDQPLRLEGAEQVAADLRGRGLQRRAGRLERQFPQRDGKAARPTWPAASTSTRRPKTTPTSPPAPAAARRSPICRRISSTSIWRWSSPRLRRRRRRRSPSGPPAITAAQVATGQAAVRGHRVRQLPHARSHDRQVVLRSRR